MNEYTRCGKGDEYVEVCMDWMNENYTKILWLFRDCFDDYRISTDKFKQTVKEVFEID